METTVNFLNHKYIKSVNFHGDKNLEDEINKSISNVQKINCMLPIIQNFGFPSSNMVNKMYQVSMKEKNKRKIVKSKKNLIRIKQSKIIDFGHTLLTERSKNKPLKVTTQIKKPTISKKQYNQEETSPSFFLTTTGERPTRTDRSCQKSFSDILNTQISLLLTENNRNEAAFSQYKVKEDNDSLLRRTKAVFSDPMFSNLKAYKPFLVSKKDESIYKNRHKSVERVLAKIAYKRVVLLRR